MLVPQWHIPDYPICAPPVSLKYILCSLVKGWCSWPFQCRTRGIFTSFLMGLFISCLLVSGGKEQAAFLCVSLLRLGFHKPFCICYTSSIDHCVFHEICGVFLVWIAEVISGIFTVQSKLIQSSGRRVDLFPSFTERLGLGCSWGCSAEFIYLHPFSL